MRDSKIQRRGKMGNILAKQNIYNARLLEG